MASVLGRAAASCSSIAEEGPLEDSPIVLAELQARRKELHLQLTDAWIETRNLAEKEQELGDSQNAGLHVSLALQYTGLASVKLLYGCFTCFFGCCARSRVPGFAGTYRGISTIIRGGPVSSPSFKRALSDEYEEGRPKLTRRLMAAGGAKPTPAQKRLAKTYVAEDKWEQAVEHETTNVWFPKMPAKQRWDLVILLLILYSCVVVPFRIGMGADAQGTMWSFEVFVTLMFLTDIFFNFNTAYPEGPNYVIDRAMIASNYLKSWFVIDALSSFPVELVDLAMEASKELARQRGEVVEDNTFAKALRALRMVRLLRMMKLLKMQELIDELEDRLGMNMQILQIVKMVVMLLYLTHLLGCGWFFIGMNAGGASSWLQSYDDGSGADAPTDVQYLYSVYWALTTLTTVGYGDITPANNAERVYALVCLLIGALVFGYILGAVGEMMSTVDKNAIALDEKLDEVKQFTRWHKMPPDLAARVRRYAEAYYARTSAMDEDSIIDGLAPALKKEVVHHLLHTTVDKIPMFMAEYVEYASLDGFQIDVHPLLKPVVYEKGEDVVTKGEYGDGLYILDKGTIGACGGMDPRRVLFQVSDMGSCFGEHCITNRSAEVSYRAVTRGQFFVLGKKDLFKLLDKYPSARSEMAEFIVEDLIRHRLLRCWALQMVVEEARALNPRLAYALVIQIVWIRRGVARVHRRLAQEGDAFLAELFPGMLSAEGGSVVGGSESAANTQRSSLGSREVSGERPPPPPAAPAGDAAAIDAELAALEAAREQLTAKDAALDQKVTAIQQAVSKLIDELPVYSA